jgi:hypothetical protein
MRTTLVRLTIAIGFTVLPVAAFAQRTFTLICHVPPGNPSNAHTLSLPDAAVKAHLAHGDLFGRCEGERVRGGQQAGADRPQHDREPQEPGGPERPDEPQIHGGGQTEHRRPKDRPQPETSGNTGRRSLWDNPPQSGGAPRTGRDPQSRKVHPETSPAGKGGEGRQPLDTFRAGNQGGNGGGSQTSNGGFQGNGGGPSGKGPHLDNGGGNGGRGSDRNNNNNNNTNNQQPQMGGRPNQPQPSHNNPQMDNGGGNGGRGSGNNQPQPSNNNPQMDKGGGNGGRGSDRNNSPGGNGGGGQPPKKKGK